MIIKIQNKRVNFNNVLAYYASSRVVYDKGVKTDAFDHFLTLDTIGESEYYGGYSFKYDSLIEVKAVIKQLDEALGVKEL